MIRSKKISRLTGTERPSSSLSSRTAPWAVVSPDCIRPVVNPQTPGRIGHCKLLSELKSHHEVEPAKLLLQNDTLHALHFISAGAVYKNRPFSSTISQYSKSPLLLSQETLKRKRFSD